MGVKLNDLVHSVWPPNIGDLLIERREAHHHAISLVPRSPVTPPGGLITKKSAFRLRDSGPLDLLASNKIISLETLYEIRFQGA